METKPLQVPETCAFYLFIRQPMGRKSALRREIPWILRGIPRASKLLICGLFLKGRVLAQDGLQLPPSSQVVRIARMLTEPALAPIRRLVPPAGRLDFSPLILLVLIQILSVLPP